MSFILRGLVPDGGGMYFLPRGSGMPKAKELIFTGRRVDGDEMLSLGIADRLVAPDELLPAAIGWAADLTQHSPTALGARQVDHERRVRAHAGGHPGGRRPGPGDCLHHRRRTTRRCEAFLERSRQRSRSES